jgi:hypothetical protein
MFFNYRDIIIIYIILLLYDCMMRMYSSKKIGAKISYLDLRVTCFSKNNLQNFHLIAIPMRERNTGRFQYNLIVTTFDVSPPQWRHQLIGVASDRASAMSGRVQGTCTHLERECHNPIFPIWCGAHHAISSSRKSLSGFTARVS